MKINKFLVNIVGIIELTIGLVTLSGHLIYFLVLEEFKPFNVLLFVLVTSMFSFLIGIGILRRNELARVVLIIFSGYIVLTKILIAFGLLEFAGDIVLILPVRCKDLISFCYHVFVIAIFMLPQIKRDFCFHSK